MAETLSAVSGGHAVGRLSGSIVTVVPSLEPRYGGPSVSVPALCRAMHDLDARVKLYFAGHHDPSETVWPQYFRHFEDGWPRRLRVSPTLRRALREEKLALVHHHALWLPTLGYAHAAARSQRVPLVISPRGMLASYALANSRFRKRVASLVVHPGAMRGAAGWHATSTGEADEIRRAGFSQPIAVAPNGVDIPVWNEPENRQRWVDRCPELAGRRVLLFYSRLHSKKGISPLLRWWAALAPRFNDWHLLIAGTPHEFGVDEVVRQIRQLNIERRTTAILSSGLPKPYRLAELYVLPTSSENFGLTVGESMASGVPVLVSDQAPWADVNRFKCGRCVPLEDFQSELESLLGHSPEQLRAMGAIGSDYVRRTFSWEQQARILLDFYATLG